MQYSHRIQTLEESVTIAVSSLARELKAKGRDILSFSAGEPDFDTPQGVKSVAIDAINAGFTKYTAVGGIPELKDAIIAKLKRENGLSYERSEVLVSNGAKHSLFNICAALIDHNDEVLIPVPFWVTYPELVKYHGGTPVSLPTSDASAFKITPEQLRAAITPRTKMLILNSPSNPTGSVYSRDELAALGKVLEGTNIWVVSDEMYEKLLFEGEFCSTAFASEDLLKRTIVVNGVSKSAAMTGWRMGYCACKDKKLIKLMDNLQGQCTSNINSITQKAAIAALDGRIDADIESMRKEFGKRRDIVVEGFAAIEGLSVVKPSGAFYVFVNTSKIETDSVRFCKALLEKEGVAVVPGSGFGMDGYFRFSFATDLQSIMQGIERISRFVRSY